MSHKKESRLILVKTVLKHPFVLPSRVNYLNIKYPSVVGRLISTIIEGRKFVLHL